MRQRGLVGAFILAVAAATAQAACLDHKKWDAILRANVDADGFVDYNGIRVNRGGDLYEYLTFVEDARLTDCTEEEKLAFWINAYNAIMVKKVLERPKMSKVSEDFKLFDERTKAARLQLSLNDIEHRIIRADEARGGPVEDVSLETLDPRIHFALVCAAIDCPKLANRAYTAKTLDEMLQAGAVRFANTPKHLRIQDGRLIVSSLLKWYQADFDKLGGVPAYLSSLTDPALRPDAAEIDAKLGTDFPDNVKYEYDWTLNAVQNRPANEAAK